MIRLSHHSNFLDTAISEYKVSQNHLAPAIVKDANGDVVMDLFTCWILQAGKSVEELEFFCKSPLVMTNICLVMTNSCLAMTNSRLVMTNSNLVMTNSHLVMTNKQN